MDMDTNATFDVLEGTKLHIFYIITSTEPAVFSPFYPRLWGNCTLCPLRKKWRTEKRKELIRTEKERKNKTAGEIF